MTWLPPMNFRSKLLALVALISGLTIALATGATSLLDYMWDRQATIHAVQTHADVIASNCAAAVVFDDPDAATDMLSALQAVKEIRSARIYDSSGKVFATYGDLETQTTLIPHDMKTDYIISGGFLELSRGIILEGDQIGAIVLRYDLRLVQRQLIRQIMVSAGCAVLAMIVSFLLAIGLQRTLTRPVMELEQIARDVSRTQDYSIRAHKYSNDELGSLTDKFNEMLSQVQTRDNALAEARDRLEDQVAQRTGELENAKALAEATADSLAQSEDRIRSILKQAPDGIITFDSRGAISLSNPAAQKIFGYHQEEFDRLHVNDLVVEAYRIDQTGVIQRGSRDGKFTAVGSHAEIVGRRKDGSEVPLQLAISQSRLIGCDAMTASIRDITERKIAEREKEQLNHRLLEESRKSGMAEIATGVLHNVGNVLTSVNVSINLINDRLTKSKVSSLAKAADLIRRHKDDLPEFIENDERGRHLPEFLVQIAEHFEKEQQELTSEMQGLVDKTQHVQEIISTQQSYAKSGGVYEKVSVEEIVQDALRINEAGLKRHNVQLRFEHNALPDIIVDKHKVLQVLVNLISNAKYAADRSKPESWITIRSRIGGAGQETIEIDVADNGVGISSENMVKIFNHGFTTRAKGHGFGLHNAALSARELGGSLQAHSDGPGRGATFTLTIPIRESDQPMEVEHEHAA